MENVCAPTGKYEIQHYRVCLVMLRACLALSHDNSDAQRSFSANKLTVTGEHAALSEEIWHQCSANCNLMKAESEAAYCVRVQIATNHADYLVLSVHAHSQLSPQQVMITTTLLKLTDNSGVESLWLLYRQMRITWSMSHIIFGVFYLPLDAFNHTMTISIT